MSQSNRTNVTVTVTSTVTVTVPVTAIVTVRNNGHNSVGPWQLVRQLFIPTVAFN